MADAADSPPVPIFDREGGPAIPTCGRDRQENLRVVMKYSPATQNAGVAKWQTQQTQNLPVATPWGFDSPLRHPELRGTYRRQAKCSRGIKLSQQRSQYEEQH